MNNLRSWMITLVSALPFARLILKGLYILALKRAKGLVEAHPEIVDIYLMSNLADKHFVYGQSDLNLVFILQDDCMPKAALKQIRKSLRQIWPANVLVDLNLLPILKESEFKTPIIRSYLVTSSKDETVKWRSIVTNEQIEFKAGKQGQFAKHHFYIQRLEKYLIKEILPRTVGKHWIRSYGKNISLALEGLAKDGLLPPLRDEKWKKHGQKLFSFSPFARMYYPLHRERTWRALDNKTRPFTHEANDDSLYPARLLEFAEQALKNPIVEDVLFIPSLLQNSDRIKGKAFVNIVLGSAAGAEINKKDLKKLQKMVEDFIEREAKIQEPELKFEFNMTTLGLLEMLHRRALFPYPLEGWYRENKTFSAKGRSYNFQIEKPFVEQAIVHFLLLQFMRFRSQKLRAGLIGSKFMKSLNLMNRYVLVLNYLTGEPLKIPEKYSDMMANITPQLGHYRSQDLVREEDWPLIKSQLVYSLKKIRDELAQERPSLKNLQF